MCSSLIITYEHINLAVALSDVNVSIEDYFPFIS